MKIIKRIGLERSSVEAYVGIAIGIVSVVFTLTWQVKTAFLIVLAFFTSLLVAESRLCAERKISTRLLAGLLVFSVVCSVGWKPIKAQYDEEQFPDDHLYIQQWGLNDGGAKIQPGNPPKVIEGAAANEIVVDGSRLIQHRDHYKLVGVCFHHLKPGDVQDEPAISKSGAYDIEDRQIKIVIPWSNQFFGEVASGITPTGYELLAVPNGISPDQFSTIRQAVAFGAKRIQRTTGGP